MTKPQRKKTNQGFHYQVPFIDDSKEKKMVPFVDALMAKTKSKRIMVVRNFFFFWYVAAHYLKRIIWILFVEVVMRIRE